MVGEEDHEEDITTMGIKTTKIGLERVAGAPGFLDAPGDLGGSLSGLYRLISASIAFSPT